MNKYNCELILDSKIQDSRITCFRVTYPRIVHSEFLRHRSHSFCSASSRAIPLSRMIEQYFGYVPDNWRKHNTGMQPLEGEFTESDIKEFEEIYKSIMSLSELKARLLHKEGKGVAKEQVNRLLEPYCYITHLVQSDEKGFDNFFNLRLDSNAQYEIRVIAKIMKEQYDKSIPIKRDFHLPFFEYNLDIDNSNFYDIAMISSARCARTSYYNHEGKKTLPSDDFNLSERLLKDKHFSPFEFPVLERFKAEEIFEDVKWHEFIENGRYWKKIELKEGTPLCIRKDFSGNLNNWKIVQFRKILEQKRNDYDV